MERADKAYQTASAPKFKHVSRSSIVMAPHDKTDDRGVQDPRVAYDSRTGIYYMFHTCFNSVSHCSPRVVRAFVRPLPDSA